MNNLFVLACGRRVLFAFVFFIITLSGWAQNWPSDRIAVHINSGDPAFPFPQFLPYKVGKNLGTHHAPGLTHADMEQSIRDAYRIMMNRALYLPHTAGDAPGKSVRYIVFNPEQVPQAGPQPFCSEGDGYALIAAALMGDRETFNGLWMAAHDYKFKRVKRYLDCVEQGMSYLPNPLPGVYDRKIDDVATNSTGEAVSGGTHDSAADGDWDIAMGIVLAARQWGEHSGVYVCGKEINYREEALRFMRALTDTLKAKQNIGTDTEAYTGKYYSGNIGFDGYAKSGNTFGEMTNWATASGFGAPKFAGPSSQYFDYMGSGYYKVFADFLEEEKRQTGTDEYDWAIFQFKRARASTNWLLEKTLEDGYLPYIGGVSLTADNQLIYDTYPTSTSPEGEDFRLIWRNLADNIWHGAPEYVWDPVSHQIIPGTTNMFAGHAENVCQHLHKPSVRAGDGCAKLGQFPSTGEGFDHYDGPFVIAQGVNKTGGHLGQLPQTRGVNWIHGVSGAAPVIAEDIDLAAYMYQQCEIEWDATPDLNSTYKNSPERYLESTPKYFHGFFKLIGMLTLSGNYYAPNDIVPKANVKTYVAIDKTYGFPADIVKYVVSLRNYGSLAAEGVSVSFDVPEAFEVVSSDKGQVSNGKVLWNKGGLAGFKSGMLASTMDSMTIFVRVKADALQGRYCATATVSGSNFDLHQSSEYPNNASYVMERNCFDVVTRSLIVTKEVDKEMVNPGDALTYKVSFENSSEAGWLDGGRPGVRWSYGQNYQGQPDAVTKFDVFLRAVHGAHEAYINLKNYRVSYYLNETAIDKVTLDKTQLGWYLGIHHYYDGDDVDKMSMTNQLIPYGQSEDGKKWNQRLIFKFDDDLISAPTAHLYQQTNNFHRIHKGTGYPFIAYLQIETRGLALNYSDDWSFDTQNDVQNEKDANVSIILPDNSDPNVKDVMTLKLHKYGCGTFNKSTDRILVEEFDGYGWRRILGSGPIPGREAMSVVVVDTLPAEVIWGGFNRSTTLGVEAEYDPDCHCVTWKKDALLVGEKGRIEYWVTVKNPSEMGTACPIDFDLKNRAWISAEAESPLVSEVVTKVTCDELPTPKPPKTTFEKIADRSSADVGEEIEYLIKYKQTQGSIGNPSLNDDADWTITGGAEFDSGSVTFKNDKDYIQYDYSHGTNGWFDFTIDVANASNVFSLVFRNTGGASNMDGVAVQFHPGPWGMQMGAVIAIIDGSTNVAESDGFKPYGGSDDGSIINFKVYLHDDKLDVWINKDPESDAPTMSASGLRVKPGYVGYYNGLIAPFKDSRVSYGSGGPNVKVVKWLSSFDSAFEVFIRDNLPDQLSYVDGSLDVRYISPGFTPVQTPVFNASNNRIEWSLVHGKTPMLYGDSVAFAFNAQLNSCEGSNFVVNTVYADILGHAENSIGAQSVVDCGKEICAKPVTLAITPADTTICEDGSVTLQAIGDVKNGDVFAWYKEGAEGEVLIQQAADLSSLEVTEEGSYYVIINPSEPLCSLRSESVGVVVNSFVVPGEIGSDQMICENGMPDEIVSLEDASGGDQASYIYGWQQSEDGSLWSDIIGANQVSYTPPVLTQTTTFRRVAESGVCPVVYSNEVTVELTEPLEAAVSIEGLPEICPGAEASFKAKPVNGGSTPEYIWYINGVEIEGERDSLLTISTLNDGDVLTVELHSSIACLLANPVLSDGLTMVVDEIVPQLEITQQIAILPCEGDEVVFEVTNVLGTGSPEDIRWYINDQFAGVTGMVFSSTNLADQDVVYAEIQSSLDCASSDPVQSNEVIVNLGMLSDPDVIISATSEEICSGDPVTFSVISQSNEGVSPVYQWYINDVEVNGATTTQFTTSSLSDGDVVRVSMISDAACLTDATAQSNEIRVTVSSLLEPKVFIALTNIGDLCEGEIAEFSITGTVAKGTAPEYQWYVNDLEVAGADDTIFLSRVSQGDRIYVVMTTNSSCASMPEAMSEEISVNVLPVEIPSVVISSSTTGILCPDETTTLVISNETATGDSPSYQWLRNGVPIGGAVSTEYIAEEPGDYSLLVNSSLRCVEDPETESNNISIQYSPEFMVTITADKSEICSYETLVMEAEVQPAVTVASYEWKADNNTVANSAENTFETSIAGSYTVMAVDENGCSATSEIVIVSSAIRNEVTISPAEEEVCEGGSVDLVSSVTNVSYTYTWLDNAGNPIQGANGPTFRASAGTYLLVINNGSCLDTSNMAVITERVLSRPVIIGENEPLCRAEGIRYYVQQPGSGSVYTWTVPPGATIVSGAGSPEITVDFGEQSGGVTVVETIGGNCSSELGELAVVLDKCDLKADFITDNSLLCEGGKVLFTNASVGVSPNTQYFWNFGSGASPATASGPGPHEVVYSAGGIYSPELTITDGIEDSEVKINSIVVNRGPDLPVISGPEIVCAYSNTEYAVNLAGQFEWTLVGNGTITDGMNTRSITVRFESAGVAYVELIYTDPNGCVAEKAIRNITVEDAAPVEIVASSTTLCAGYSSKIMLHGGNGNITWYRNGNLIPGQHGAELTVSEGGEYSAVLRGACEQHTNSVSISLVEFSVSAGADMLVDEGQPVQIITETSHPAVDYTWMPMLPNVANPVFTPTETTVYTVTATDENGCQASDEVKITVVRPLFIPNAFTPNGDGVHDVWEITGLERYGNDVVVRIFNRWGNVVYEDKGYAFRWDGTKNGTAMPVATYYYVVELPGDEKPLTGYILLSK